MRTDIEGVVPQAPGLQRGARHLEFFGGLTLGDTLSSQLPVLLKEVGAFESIPAWLAIDLQKMNWKFQAGFREHTGVSLKLSMPTNFPGGYTRVHQDTAQSYDCQRPPPASSARLSAR